jgi:hypothetical protein
MEFEPKEEAPRSHKVNLRSVNIFNGILEVQNSA